MVIWIFSLVIVPSCLLFLGYSSDNKIEHTTLFEKFDKKTQRVVSELSQHLKDDLIDFVSSDGTSALLPELYVVTLLLLQLGKYLILNLA